MARDYWRDPLDEALGIQQNLQIDGGEPTPPLPGIIGGIIGAEPGGGTSVDLPTQPIPGPGTLPNLSDFITPPPKPSVPQPPAPPPYVEPVKNPSYSALMGGVAPSGSFYNPAARSAQSAGTGTTRNYFPRRYRRNDAYWRGWGPQYGVNTSPSMTFPLSNVSARSLLDNPQQREQDQWLGAFGSY